jgi:hypothetical protein
MGTLKREYQPNPHIPKTVKMRRIMIAEIEDRTPILSAI